MNNLGFEPVAKIIHELQHNKGLIASNLGFVN